MMTSMKWILGHALMLLGLCVGERTLAQERIAICFEDETLVVAGAGTNEKLARFQHTPVCSTVESRYPYYVPQYKAAPRAPSPDSKEPGNAHIDPHDTDQAVGIDGRISNSKVLTISQIQETRALLEEQRLLREGIATRQPNIPAIPGISSGINFPIIPPALYPFGNLLKDEFSRHGFRSDINDDRAPLEIWHYVNIGLQDRELGAHAEYENDLASSISRTAANLAAALPQAIGDTSAIRAETITVAANATRYMPDNNYAPLSDFLKAGRYPKIEVDHATSQLNTCILGGNDFLDCVQAEQNRVKAREQKCDTYPGGCGRGQYGFKSPEGPFRSSLESLAGQFEVADKGLDSSVASNIRRAAKLLGLGALYEADIQNAVGNRETAAAVANVSRLLLDVAIGANPILSTARTTYEILSGRNLLTGEELSGTDYALAIVNLVTLGISQDVIVGSKALRNVVHEVNPEFVRRFETTLADVSEWWVDAKVALGNPEGASAELAQVLRSDGIDSFDRMALIKSFDPKTIKTSIATGEERLFRYHNKDTLVQQQGRFYVSEYADVVTDRMRYAIPQTNQMTWLEEGTLKKGTHYFEGTARGDFGSSGGGHQFFVPDPSTVTFQGVIRRPGL